MAVTCPQTNPAVQGPVLPVVGTVVVVGAVVTVVLVGAGLVVFVIGWTLLGGFFDTTEVFGVVVPTVATVVVGLDRPVLATRCALEHAPSRTANIKSTGTAKRLEGTWFIGRARRRSYREPSAVLPRSESTAMAAFRPFTAITLPPG